MRPSDIDNDEILAVLRDANPEAPYALTAIDVAHLVWRNRGVTTPKLTDRHVKPGLVELVDKGEVLSATGYRAEGIGRVTLLRRTTTYYVLAEYGRTYAGELARQEELSRQGRALAVQLRDTHGERLASIKGTSDGGVAMTLTFGQASALLELWDSAAPNVGQEGSASLRDSIPGRPGQQPELRRIPIGHLTVDRGIRPDIPPEVPDESVVKRPDLDYLSLHYDPNSLGVLQVSQRADGSLVIIDGCRRHKVAAEREPDDFAVDCRVFTGLVPEEEAAMAASLHRATSGSPRKGREPVRKLRKSTR